MPFAVSYAKSAVKELRDLQPKKAAAVRAAIEAVAVDPRAKNNNLEPMKGQQGAFRLRVGDIRVLFTLDHAAQVMDVVKIRHRREVYR